MKPDKKPTNTGTVTHDYNKDNAPSPTYRIPTPPPPPPPSEPKEKK